MLRLRLRLMLRLREADVQDGGFQMKHCIFCLPKDVWYWYRG